MIGDIFQPTHLLFLLVIVLLVLGPKRLPEVARSLGRGFRDFKDAISGESHQPYNEIQQHPISPSAPPVAPDPVDTAHAAEPVAAPADDPIAATAHEPGAAPVATEVQEPAAPVATQVEEPIEAPAPAPEAPEPEPVAAPAAKDSGTGAS